MPRIFKNSSKKRAVIFPQHHRLLQNQRLGGEKMDDSRDMKDLLDGFTLREGSDNSTLPKSNIPLLFSEAPLLRDPLNTESSLLQDATVSECLPWLLSTASQASSLPLNSHGIPRLNRQEDIPYLKESMLRMPGTYVGYDASRPWILYWALAGLMCLGEDVMEYRERYECYERVL
jgi:hypothetical protein